MVSRAQLSEELLSDRLSRIGRGGAQSYRIHGRRHGGL